MTQCNWILHSHTLVSCQGPTQFAERLAPLQKSMHLKCVCEYWEEATRAHYTPQMRNWECVTFYYRTSTLNCYLYFIQNFELFCMWISVEFLSFLTFTHCFCSSDEQTFKWSFSIIPKGIYVSSNDWFLLIFNLQAHVWLLWSVEERATVVLSIQFRAEVKSSRDRMRTLWHRFIEPFNFSVS